MQRPAETSSGMRGDAEFEEDISLYRDPDVLKMINLI